MSLPKSPPSKVFRKSPAEIFTRTASLLKKSPRNLAEGLGYSPTSASKWLETGEMPYVAALACRALEQQEAVAAAKVILIRSPSGEKGALLQALLSQLSIEHVII